jgi:RNA polymerase sigma-70 factor (ECF subfamily)
VSSRDANPALWLRLTVGVVEEELPLPAVMADRIALLTRLLAKGDEEAFREFHALYFDRLYQFLLVVAEGREDQARDALQETLLRVLRYARVFEQEEVFWCWLKALARSAARDAGRKQRRYMALLRNFALLPREHCPETARDEEARMSALLAQSLEELDPEDRRLLESKYLEGETIRELSAQTGLSDKAVESRLSRLRRQLREKLLEKLRRP